MWFNEDSVLCDGFVVLSNRRTSAVWACGMLRHCTDGREVEQASVLIVRLLLD